MVNGEVVVVLGEDDEGWTKIKNQDGDEGFVPTNYLGDLEY